MSYIKEKYNRMVHEYAEEAKQYPFDPYNFGESDEDEWSDMMEERPELSDRPDDYDDDPYYEDHDYPF